MRNKGPCKNIDDLQIELGLVPPVEYEHNHHRHNIAPTPVGASGQSLH